MSFLPAAGVAIQHRLQPCAIVALLRRPQHVGPPEDVPLQRGGAQDGARAPPGHVHRPGRSVAALRAASHQHLTALKLISPSGLHENRTSTTPVPKRTLCLDLLPYYATLCRILG